MCIFRKNENIDDDKETIFPEVTHPEDMEECVGDEKRKKIDDEIEATCPDVTPPDIMDGGVGEENMTMMKLMMMKKRQNAQISLLLLIWRKVQVKKYDKNDRIDEGKSEVETTDSVSTTVNDAECPYLTPPVDMEEGLGKKKMRRIIEQRREKVKVKQQIL